MENLTYGSTSLQTDVLAFTVETMGKAPGQYHEPALSDDVGILTWVPDSIIRKG
jgi:hypothetical protein